MQPIDAKEEKKIKNILNYSYIKIDLSLCSGQFFQERKTLADKLQIDSDSPENFNNFKVDQIADYLPEGLFKRKVKEKSKRYPDIDIRNVLIKILQNMMQKNNIGKKDWTVLFFLQKKFEVSRKIYQKYDSSMNKKSNSYDDIEIYSLLAIIFSLCFIKTKKWNLLNSVFKLNDLILKSGWRISRSQKQLVYISLILEKGILKNLYEL
ncbi:hypothetical protein A3D77_04350 [Candidatus Gottesmanbacteria bacterium RIFCSPHIGHO2_02_FULL_39_11]|uniref:Uncharacterized protein n=1 Tax=Candidatus Gottesmanbacteria bacterium RIFCSPHIGHO2_02_FULL_39_11 TaxID=1798382 RepID=A0A1F5ZJQ3_9BACT|nr:MAG: hypothetical protein A3D77_04350 [Candidatus Gottesmanbacteria bacterium RIFCSPHIGHO2_02_FULL_39_11]